MVCESRRNGRAGQAPPLQGSCLAELRSEMLPLKAYWGCLMSGPACSMLPFTSSVFTSDF